MTKPRGYPVLSQELMDSATSEGTSSAARSVTLFKLDELKKWMEPRLISGDEQQRVHYFAASKKIDLFEKGEKKGRVPTRPNAAPDGSPIDPGQDWLEPICGWEN